nr:MAG TPA: hypothetical protein [Caudoviricetes sp.]
MPSSIDLTDSNVKVFFVCTLTVLVEYPPILIRFSSPNFPLIPHPFFLSRL